MNRITRGPIIGMVDHKKAKIWVYAYNDEDNQAKPYCHVKFKDKASRVSGSPFEFKEVSNFPYIREGALQKAYVTEIRFPDEGKEFSFGISYDREIKPGEFKYLVKRFPEEGDIDFSFGLISCHKPRDKKLKRIDTMWGFMYEKMLEKDSRFLIQAGDQVYCDSSNDSACINAWAKSLELVQAKPKAGDPEHRQMVDFYREVYFRGWEFPPVQKVMSTFPQYMIWDDHEIEDGWGSKPEQFTDMQQKIFEAAKEAYVEFQHSHNPEPLIERGMYYAFHFGAAAFLVLDLRGERNIKEKRLLSEEQKREIEKWLNSEKVKNSKILFVVSSVPVVHVSRGLMSMAKVVAILFKDVKDDIADQWSYRHNKKERQWLLKLLIDWSQTDGNKPVVILGGDVHVGTEATMNKKGADKKIYQVTSSPITNNRALVLDFFSAPISSRFHFTLDNETREQMYVRVKRRHRRRNFAILQVKYDAGKPKVKLEMFRQGKIKPKTWELF